MSKLAYTLDEAAEACGVSREVIRQAIRAGDLVQVFPTSRPVILREDLERWITSKPTEHPRAS